MEGGLGETEASISCSFCCSDHLRMILFLMPLNRRTSCEVQTDRSIPRQGDLMQQWWDVLGSDSSATKSCLIRCSSGRGVKFYKTSSRSFWNKTEQSSSCILSKERLTTSAKNRKWRVLMLGAFICLAWYIPPAGVTSVKDFAWDCTWI